ERSLADTPPAPHDTCQWILHGRLLAGSFPGDRTEPWHSAKVRSLIDAGVTTFLCLQETGELRRFTPYMALAKRLKAEKLGEEELQGSEAAASSALDFFHCPTPDCSVTSTDAVLAGLRTIVSKLREGATVYVHCWGGHGRTGTMICAFLAACYGLTPEQAQEFYNTGERRRGARNGYWPASQAQYDQVEAIAALTVQDIWAEPRLLEPLMDWDLGRPRPPADSGGSWCGCDSISVAPKT
ncbi:ptn1, partial [Symbiodinium natans]